MTDTTGGMPPAGWYPDPYGQPFERWWDGSGWTEHTNTPATAAPEPVAPAAPVASVEPVAALEPVTPEPVAYQPVSAAPAAYEPPPLEEPPAATSDPFAGFVSPAEPAPYQAPAYEAPVFEQPVFEQPVFEQPVFEQPLFEQPLFEQPVFTEPAAAEPTPYLPPARGYEPRPTEQVFGADLFGQPPADAEREPFSFGPAPTLQPTPVDHLDRSAFIQQTPAVQQPAVQTNPGVPNAASSFDFGFGDIIAGGPAPSNSSVEAPPGEEGLFNSWEPNEYVEEPRNGPANAGLALGVLSFFLSALTGIPGLIASVVGIGRASQFDRNGDGPVGRGKAIAGLALSIIGSAVSAALILYGLQLFTASQEQTVDPGANTTVDTPLEGAIGLEVGDMGTITLTDSEAAAIQFTVTGITTNFTCTAPESVSPANGQFVAVEMAFTLSPDYLSRMNDGVALRMNQSDWIGFLGDESATQVDSTDAGNSCISAAEQLPTEFPAGENISGMIVLDMAEGIASVSYAPSGVTGIDPGMTRWEWVIPV